MKNLVFIRGPESDLKRQVVNSLMQTLNPDINHVRAIRISLSDRINNDWSDKQRVKAADKDCKNLTKKVLGGNHQEEYIVIDNESLRSVHWQSYNNLSVGIGVQSMMIGIDVVPENISNDGNSKKINLHERESAVFIAACYKYHCIKNYDELQGVIETFRS